MWVAGCAFIAFGYFDVAGYKDSDLSCQKQNGVPKMPKTMIIRWNDCFFWQVELSFHIIIIVFLASLDDNMKWSSTLGCCLELQACMVQILFKWQTECKTAWHRLLGIHGSWAEKAQQMPCRFYLLSWAIYTISNCWITAFDIEHLPNSVV